MARIEAIQMEKYEQVITDENGNTRVVEDPSRPTYSCRMHRDIIDHITECPSFKQLYGGNDPRHFTEQIMCDCGAVWEIREADIRFGTIGYELKTLMKAIWHGDVTKDMPVIREARAKAKKEQMKKKVMILKDRLHSMKAKLQDEKAKKIAHPIFSLEINDEG